jgi:hypothetical protein
MQPRKHILSHHTRRRGTRVLLWVLGCAVTLACITPASPGESLLEQQVKAAFLYNFARFVNWPESAFENQHSPIVFGVLGEDAILPALEQMLAGNSINGRELRCKLLKSTGSVKGFHLIFVRASEADLTAGLVQDLKGHPVLMVGEMEGFLQQGGIINFFTEQNKLRFEINMDAAERAQLKLSSKLLTVAKLVRDAPLRARN